MSGIFLDYEYVLNRIPIEWKIKIDNKMCSIKTNLMLLATYIYI